jgi:hypothetical protein
MPQVGVDYGANQRKAVRIATAQVNPKPGKRMSNPRSSEPRPNPEIRTRVRQFFSEGNNGGYFFAPGTATETVYTRFWSGVRTPGFGKLKKAQRPVNPHSVSIVEVHDSGLLEQTNIPSTGIYFNQYQAWTNHYSPPALPSHDARAVQKALKSLRGRLENEIEGNLAQDVVQIRQTISLIANTAKTLAKTGIALKNGNIPQAVATLWGSSKPRYGKKGKKPTGTKSAADNWLQMQYGWKPLLMDIHGAMESLAKLNLADASVKQVTASARIVNWEVKDLPLFQNSTTYGGWVRAQTVSRCKFGMQFTVDNHLIAFLAQTGFTNPLNLGWELLPFSFVADWFLPIGPWLETLSTFHGLRFFGGYQTLFTKQHTESLIRFSGETPPGQFLQANGNYSRDVVLLNRVKLSAPPVSSFPSFKSPVTVTHALNALALLKSVFH